MSKSFRAVVVVGSACLAAACGGGGGGGGEPPPLSDDVPITASNQDAVARVTAFVVLDTVSTPDPGTAWAAGAKRAAQAVPTSTASAVPPAGATRMALRALRTALQPAAARGMVRAMAVTSRSESCAVSGSLTASIDDRDNNDALSAGDVITLAFAQCREMADSLADGRISLTVSSYAETSTAMTVDAVFTFQQMKTAIGSSSSTIDGTTSARYAETAGVDGWDTSLVLRVGAGGMLTAISQPGFTDTLTYEEGFEIKTAIFVPDLPSATLHPQRASLNGRLRSPALGGKLALTTVCTPSATAGACTLEELNRLAVDNYPFKGRIRVGGRSDSALLLSALSAVQVRLALDANGDGLYESSKDVAWSTLLP